MTDTMTYKYTVGDIVQGRCRHSNYRRNSVLHQKFSNIISPQTNRRIFIFHLFADKSYKDNAFRQKNELSAKK